MYSCGGNLLVNIGITADGRIIPIFEERLRQMGIYVVHTDVQYHVDREVVAIL